MKRKIGNYHAAFSRLELLAVAALLIGTNGIAAGEIKTLYIKNNTPCTITVGVATDRLRLQGFAEPGRTCRCAQEGGHGNAGKKQICGGWDAKSEVFSVQLIALDANGTLYQTSVDQVIPNEKGEAAIWVGPRDAGEPPSAEEKATATPLRWGLGELMKDSPSAEQQAECDLEKLKKAVVAFYDNEGEWAGRYHIHNVEKAEVMQISSHRLLAYVTYNYSRLGEDEVAGQDSRRFHITLDTAPEYYVTQMDGYKSADDHEFKLIAGKEPAAIPTAQKLEPAQQPQVQPKLQSQSSTSDF